MSKEYWVYVIQSQRTRTGDRGKELPGLYYVGMTTDLLRRLNEHNGFTATGNPTLKGKGGKFTSQHRPYTMQAVYGPYVDRSEAQKAEYALKHKKRGQSRCLWRPEEHPLCRGLGRKDPRVEEINEKAYVAAGDDA